MKTIQLTLLCVLALFNLAQAQQRKTIELLPVCQGTDFDRDGSCWTGYTFPQVMTKEGRYLSLLPTDPTKGLYELELPEESDTLIFFYVAMDGFNFQHHQVIEAADSLAYTLYVAHEPSFSLQVAKSGPKMSHFLDSLPMGSSLTFVLDYLQHICFTHPARLYVQVQRNDKHRFYYRTWRRIAPNDPDAEWTEWAVLPKAKLKALQNFLKGQYKDQGHGLYAPDYEKVRVSMVYERVIYELAKDQKGAFLRYWPIWK